MTRARLIAWAAIGLVLVAAIAISRGRNDAHQLRTTFSSAVQLVPGADVRAGGARVGRVRSIAVAGRAARVDLEIDDARLWPLRSGTQARIRLGGTLSYANRYVELQPGPDGARPLAAGAELPAADATSPFEFDQVLNVFDPRTRAGLGALIDRGADTFGPRGATLRQAIASAGPAFDETAATLERIGADPHALQTLVLTGSRTAGALASRDGQLRDLVDGAATTLTTIAGSGTDVESTLARAPVALSAARGTLGRLDRSLGGVDGLVGDIAPGARGLRRISSPLAGAVQTLKDVAPPLDATLTRLRQGGPAIAGFLDSTVPLARRLGPTLTRLAPMVACLRAYTPDIIGFFSLWQAPTYDASGRYARVNPQFVPFSNLSTSPSSTAASQQPDMRYAMPRPPGLNAGQPWLVDSCGAGSAALDPNADPEARP
jgi:ABC-type transporter Mla subunit MlaD